MGLLSLLAKDPVIFAVLAVLLLYSVIAHEVAHGWVAGLFGDNTARQAGRLTANPASHIDPIGLLMLFVAGFGWAKPVPVDYGSLRASRLAFAAVALAGPLTNILIATAAVLFLQMENVRTVPYVSTPLAIAARINIILAAFNLIPIPPLDGSKIVGELLPDDVRGAYLRLERFGLLFVVILLFTNVLNPVISFMEKHVYMAISLIVSLLV